MGRRRKKKEGVCAYCGQCGPITNDHVPPKCFFGSKRPHGINLITVPCCEKCKRHYEKLDERLKVLLTTVIDPEENPVVAELWVEEGSIARGAKRPEAEGFRRGLLRAVFPVELRTPSGLYVGQTGGFRPAEVGVPEFIERVVKALYFEEREEPLPGNRAVRWIGRPSDFLRLQSEEMRRQIAGAMRQHLRTIHNDVFSYGYVHASEDPTAAIWFLYFFKSLSFAAISGTQAMLAGHPADSCRQ